MSLVTKQQAVLSALIAARDSFLEVDGKRYFGWVPADLLERDDIGGRSATRRVRELRNQGWKVEQRRALTGRWEYQLVGNPNGRTFCDLCGRDPTSPMLDTVTGRELWLCDSHAARFQSLKGFALPGKELHR